MHTYEKVDVPFEERPGIDTYEFRCVADVVAYAAVETTIGWKSYPEVWHLDERGRFACYYKADSLSTVVKWAGDPYPLLRSRRDGEREGGCGPKWLVIDSRPAWNWPEIGPIPTDADAAAFLELRNVLEPMGVDLVDVVVFDDASHWWSMREVTLGSTEW